MTYRSDTIFLLETRVRKGVTYPICVLVVCRKDFRTIVFSDANGDGFAGSFELFGTDIDKFIKGASDTEYTTTLQNMYDFTLTINAKKQELIWIDNEQILHFDIEQYPPNQWKEFIEWLSTEREYDW